MAIISGRTDASDKYGQGLAALIVDDEPHILLYFCELLGSQGFEVEVAESVSDALRRLAATPYDLIIADKNLPDGSGLDIAAHVHSTTQLCEMVIISAYATVEALVEAMQNGVADFITKPFTSIEELHERLRRVTALLELKRKYQRMERELTEKDQRIQRLEEELATLKR